MASDKRPILSGKRARSRRKRAALRAANRVTQSPTPECDSDEDAKRIQLAESGRNSSIDKSTLSQIENELEDGLVLVCRPTMPDFCSAFVPQGDEQTYHRSRRTLPHAEVDGKTFTLHISSFQETREGFVTYKLELSTCDQPRYAFQLERRFSEFVVCASEVNKQLASGFAARCCAQRDDEESKATASEVADTFQWELPAKTWFRLTQTDALEARRAQLEQSLEKLLQVFDGRICNLPVLRDFLMLDIFGAQVAEQKNLEACAHFDSRAPMR
ncbi:hypothetical protein PsorP6_006105 [Peronosclerospora sorghi]|uniref:Uncharacterized protein n=1 Tax=Peronosclerospora sorghi TaxID=230839 RepID=A0ACC0W3Q2_9STRA|nr:hypothetical protein PsorP6_006105 [Peronosclerospora sorghi]